MLSNPKLPPFAGRCHIQLLRGEAAQAADTAAYLRAFRALSPEALCRAGQLSPAEQRAGAEAGFGHVLAAMATVLLLYLMLAGCAAAGQKAAEQRHRHEHAAPAHGPRAWHNADSATD